MWPDPRLRSDQIAHRASAADHIPEVVIRVVNGGGNRLLSIQQHIEDLHRGIHRTLETDDGNPVTSKAATKRLIEEWDLDLEEFIHRLPYVAPARRKPPKLVHKLVLCMPAGTDPDKLLLAVRAFAQEEFGFTRRYALALHTDTPNPHVHVVVKVTSEDCQRLNIRRATLREWRRAFARYLHTQGVAAKVTQRIGPAPLRSNQLNGVRRPPARRPAPLAP